MYQIIMKKSNTKWLFSTEIGPAISEAADSISLTFKKAGSEANIHFNNSKDNIIIVP